MKRTVRFILKWVGRILLGLLTLVTLVVIVFYLFRGKIIDRGLDYVNAMQPGNVQLEKIHIRPFRHFPDITLQLKELSFSHVTESTKELGTVPLFRMDEIYISMDVVKLIKGKYRISKVRMGEGEINYIVFADSVSNLEMALGISFKGVHEEEEVKVDSSTITLDMKDLEITNLVLNYVDEAGRINVSARINQLKSAFSYLPDMITAVIDLDLDLDRAEYEDIVLDKPRSILLKSSLNYDPDLEKVTLDHSTLDIKDAIFELSGDVLLAQNNYMNIKFNAKNEGIELLNFILMGILDMDEIEQIGSGEIAFGGEIVGSIGDQLPEIKVNFRASDLGFKVKAINQSITDISFEGFATNGTISDFSEAELNMEYFHASFPEGKIDLNMHVSNLVHPVVDISIDGNVDLSIVNSIIETETIRGLKGNIIFGGNIDGIIDASREIFLDGGGSLTARLENVSFSLPDNEVEQLNGTFFLHGKSIEFKGLDVILDENAFTLNGEVQNILPYFFGFSLDPDVLLVFESEELYPEKFISDTSITNFFDGPIRGLGFSISLNMGYDQFIKVMNEAAIPNVDIMLQDLHVKIPGYADISKVELLVEVDEKDISVSNFKGRIGTSSFDLDVKVSNYNAFIAKDSSAELGVDFQLTSRTMNALDLLTFKDKFMLLPETYKAEQIKNFMFKGKVETKVGELLKEKGIPEFRFTTDDVHWDFKYYPLSFRDFNIDIQLRENLILVNNFEGSIGESNIKFKALVANLLDSTKAISGNLDIQSELLDFNKLLDYELMTNTKGVTDVAVEDDTTKSVSFGLQEFDFPDFKLNVDIKEIRYEENRLYGLLGQIRSIPGRIVYLDKFTFQSETGGTVLLDGQLNLIDPNMYTLSATFDIDTLNISDFNVAFSMDSTTYTLDQTFTGMLDATGIAEVFLLPDLNVDLKNTTASFNLSLKDGSVKSFTPLQAVAKYTGNKDLDNVKFGEIRNRFTLVNETIYIPLMSINSTLGQIGIEGEQGMDGHYLYLVRVPKTLIRETAKNVLSGQKESEGEEEIAETKSGLFRVITVSDQGVKMGDQRDKFK